MIVLRVCDWMGETVMDISRKLGILIVLGVPVIVGGGIAHGLFGGWMPVAVWELVVATFAVAVIRR